MYDIYITQLMSESKAYLFMLPYIFIDCLSIKFLYTIVSNMESKDMLWHHDWQTAESQGSTSLPCSNPR